MTPLAPEAPQNTQARPPLSPRHRLDEQPGPGARTAVPA